ncbi:MAG: hypothetical protein Q8R02_13475 [Hyphomonadaceae bacterium]|nr:hypothetical protein [Hyphomonadaceae bacterium]
MATIVPMGDKVPVRVGPKVFADVPSQRELDDARKSRNGLVIWTVLLAGALIAAVAFIVYLTVLERPVPVDNSIIERVKAAELARDGAVAETAKKQQELTNLQSLVGEYRGIAERQRDFGQLQADIRAAISPPGLPEAERKAREADVRNRLRLLKTEWAAFDEGAKWAGTSKDQVQAGLDNQVNSLITLKGRIDGLGLAAPPPKPAGPCTDVTKC